MTDEEEDELVDFISKQIDFIFDTIKERWPDAKEIELRIMEMLQ